MLKFLVFILAFFKLIFYIAKERTTDFNVLLERHSTIYKTHVHTIPVTYLHIRKNEEMNHRID